MGISSSHLDRLCLQLSSLKSPLLFYLLVFVYAFLNFIPALGIGRVYQVSEGREGVVVNEMLATGNFILPLRNGELVPSKPPFFHWLGVLTAHLFGDYTEFELRLPSAIAAIGCVLLVASFARALAGPSAGFLSAFILCTTYDFGHLAADGRVDMVFCFLVTAAVISWLRVRHQRALYIVALCAGLAVLTKGPLGAVLPIVIIASINLAENGFRGLKELLHPAWLITVLLPLPWFILAFFQAGKGFVQRQVIFENLTRFAGGEGIVSKYWWFYVEHIWLDWAPWTFVFLGAALYLIYQKKQYGRGISFLPEEPQTRALCQACIVWIAVPFILFTLSAGKRRAYLLPLIPGFSLLLSLCLLDWLQKLREHRLVFSRRRIVIAAGIIQLSAIIVVSVTQIVRGYLFSYRDFSTTVRSVVDESQTVHFVKTLRDESFDGFFFYYRRHVVTHDPETPITEPGIYLARDGWLSEHHVQGEVLARGGRRRDKPEQQLVLMKIS